MTISGLKQLTQQIVSDAKRLNATHTDEGDAPVNYACIFSQSTEEYELLLQLAKQLGQIIQQTPTGPVFKIPALQTDAGNVELLKVRRPDPMRPERGDADFTVADFARFKQKHLNKQGFGLIERQNMEMVELIDPSFDVLAYFSHPTLAEILSSQKT